MVSSNTTIMSVGILAVLIFVGLPCLEAQSPMGAPKMSPGIPMPMAPAPAVDCLTALTNVSDCLTYVQTGSNLTVPDKACCPELAGLLESNPICLCTLISQGEAYGVDINRALMLPDVCKVSIPPLDSCPSTDSPTLAPTPGTPGPASDVLGPTTAGPAPDSGIALGPATAGRRSGASRTVVHDLSTIVCLAVAIFIAYYF